MSWPATRPYSGRDKRGDVAFHLILVVLGALGVAWGVATVPPERVWMRALIGNGAWGVILSIVLVVAMVSKAQLPSLRRTVFEGKPALVVRAWDQKWWHTCGMDLGFLCTGVAMALVGAVVGGAEGVTAVVLAPLGLWFHIRFVLVAARRRRRHALWITAQEVVLDTVSGRTRAPRTAVREVRVHGEADQLAIELRDPVDVDLCPKAWREKRVAASTHTLVFDCTHTAHRAADVAGWLQSRLCEPPDSAAQCSVLVPSAATAEA